MSSQAIAIMPEDLLESVISRVFETMFFAECESFCHRLVAKEMLWTEVAFEGSLAGKVWLGLDPALARTLSVDFFGVSSEEELESGSVDYMLRELANVVCGSSLSVLQPNSLFQICSPRRSTAPAIAGQGVSLLVQGNTVQVALMQNE